MNSTYNKQFSDESPTHNGPKLGDALSVLLFVFALERGKTRGNRLGLELKGIKRLLCADT
jgi:hypothetical protein